MNAERPETLRSVDDVDWDSWIPQQRATLLFVVKDGNVLLDLQLPNLIVTPHVAWASVEAMQILADQLIDNIEAFVSGSPQNVVD